MYLQIYVNIIFLNKFKKNFRVFIIQIPIKSIIVSINFILFLFVQQVRKHIVGYFSFVNVLYFVNAIIVNKIKTKDLSKKLKIPPSRLSEITNYKIKKYTVDQLMKYLAVLAEHEPKIEAYLNILGQSAELPTMNLTNSKKLTKEIKKYSYSGLSAR